MKISVLLDREANELALIQELAGNIEAISENVEVMRATIRKESVQGDGELIRDEIAI